MADFFTVVTLTPYNLIAAFFIVAALAIAAIVVAAWVVDRGRSDKYDPWGEW